MNKRKTCAVCRKLTFKWQKINGGPIHCYDGCHSTLGVDRRTYDGNPAWLPHGEKAAWDTSRMIRL